jgi:hypothetical protein
VSKEFIIHCGVLYVREYCKQMGYSVFGLPICESVSVTMRPATLDEVTEYQAIEPQEKLV